MKKNILLIGNHPPPFGGVPTHIKSLSEYLVERGWKVHILSLSGNPLVGRSSAKDSLPYQIHRPSRLRMKATLPLAISFKSYSRLAKNTFPYLKSFISNLGAAVYIKRLCIREKIDVISAYHITAGWYAAPASESLGIPLITTVFGEMFARPESYKKHRRLVEYAIEQSKFLLSCSKHCAGSFSNIGISEKARTVYYGIDTERFSKTLDPSAVLKKHGVSEEDDSVLYVARMVEEMGLGVLLEAIPICLKKLPHLKFMIIGAEGELTGRAKELEQLYSGNVSVRTNIPFEELPFYYSGASLTVVPSINERACLGLAIVESLCAKTACIVSDVGGGPEVIKNEETGWLVPPKDPEALAQKILKAFEDPRRLEEFGLKGQKDMLQRFDAKQTNECMEKLFLEAGEA